MVNLRTVATLILPVDRATLRSGEREAGRPLDSTILGRCLFNCLLARPCVAHPRRDSTRLTVTACQRPPSGVATLRSFNADAILPWDKPTSSANTGLNCSARSQACSRLAIPLALRPPSLTPCAFFAASASRVRGLMRRPASDHSALPAGSPVADVRISSSMVVAGCQQELLSY
jgi:hypothetical protein